MEFFIEYKPYFLVAHVVSALIGVSSAVLADILFTFYSKDRDLSSREIRRLDKLSKLVWVSLMVIIITGLSVFLSDPATYLASSKFLAKMTAVAVLTANGYVLYKFVQPRLKKKGFLIASSEKGMRRVAFICGAVSLSSWSVALGLAFLDDLPFSYIQIISVYLGVLVLAGMVAVFAEERFSRSS